MIADPALSFWLQYAEREGALFDADGPATALVVLPEGLQARHQLPEEVAVTADPDVARDDGALLLAPGHPVIEQGADRVLAEGDVGVGWLPWPASSLPDRAELEGRARDWFPVDHGRIDAADTPRAAYLPVLRAGALVTYEVSLDTRFQERAEVWVDAARGRELSASVAARLGAGVDPSAERNPCSPLEVSLGRAVRRASTLLQNRAGARLAELEGQAAQARDEELARAAAYYDAASASIRRRRATASTDRAEVLDAQAEVTRLERERRVTEIHEKFRPRLRLRPFRLHLVLVPAVRLSVHVRRGPRAYPWEVVWMLPTATFSPAACPSCGSGAVLVAGRDRLGCRACLG